MQLPKYYVIEADDSLMVMNTQRNIILWNPQKSHLDGFYPPFLL